MEAITTALPYTTRGKALRARGADYKLTSYAGRDEQAYAAQFYKHGLPDDMKPRDVEDIRTYLQRVLRAAPSVVAWVDKYSSSPRRTVHCPCCSDLVRRHFLRRFTSYLVDYYFCEVGRCVAEED